MKKIKEFLWVLMHPAFWVQTATYSEAWDKKLNYLIENHKFEYCNEHIAIIGNVEVWINNYPYGCMNPYHQVMSARPSRHTIYKAYKKYIKDVFEHENKQN